MLLRFVLAAIQGWAELLDAVVLFMAVLIAYAIPSVAEIKTYFFGAMFYGVFIVAMVLNGRASMASIESLLARTGLATDIRRHLLTAGRVLALAIALDLFVKHVVIGQLSVATPLSAQQQDSIKHRPSVSGRFCATSSRRRRARFMSAFRVPTRSRPRPFNCTRCRRG